MSANSQYFARAPMKGAGMLNFLIVPRAAPVGSGPRALLGSLVDEIDVGLFGTREIPNTELVGTRGYVLEAINRNPDLAGKTLVEEESLASTTQTLVVNRKFKLGLGVPFPGVPDTASVGLDYSKVRRVELSLGEGCRKLYIPTSFLKDGYDHAQRHSDQFHWSLFHDDYMAVRQILLVRNLSILVTSESEFTAGFEAKAKDVNDAKVGINYHREDQKSYRVSIAGDQDYLFALGAVQLDKIKD